ncbi:MAG: 2-C-methyl-D-erythritol 4-phosphate cytidylyltransferase [SAR202 cluster bacterium Io17-Chloro-G6]|nr:MAG: 2-C-methyl-D-erythritol 4-phosphate cytidylyltransferase [SAR202 cluster bacterium Io17-Chloro-G6]
MAQASGPGTQLPSRRVGAVVVAAGKSTRMKGVDKVFTPVLGIPLLAYSLDRLESFPSVEEIVLVLSPDSLYQGNDLLRNRGYRKVSHVCAGGERRQDSVRLGLEQLSDCRWVIVHDGARPCLDQGILERGLTAVEECGAAVAGVPVKDTIKLVSPQGEVTGTPDRESLWAAQTPQLFDYDLLLDAHRRCTQPVTDDAAMVESLGHPVKMFLGSYENLKVTTPGDLTIAETFLKPGVL